MVRKKQRIGPDIRLMVPKTAGGKRMRDALVRLPLMRGVGAVERLTPATRVRALPECSR
ncbi:hypothetical protein [Planotetraspora mira]|uniref:Uncharacterized protein n=1 Tax=Planotetraspora mira TaxID=58121 RepID=A0A8J3X8A9_9ACTN|nr:hypothetical protein [Planotetraspora mira]GII31987.1 hypothetical protein Pmi06nite_54290 [Planotetraspora mira]